LPISSAPLLKKNSLGLRINNRVKKRKAVFLDRDGTLVVHIPFLSSPEQLRLLPNAVEGIRLFKKSGYAIVIVTNQSGVARGYFNEAQLKLVHNKLLTMLEWEGICIDDIYYCPHHLEGVIEEYRRVCDCRKPKPKMLLDAARYHDIDLTKSLMIGDSECDILAGKNAGCTSVLIRDTAGNDLPITPTGADYIVENLLEAAKLFT
jgi:D-glycero-D-manno-heptose 1,7-bisphosphate phosphatase